MGRRGQLSFCKSSGDSEILPKLADGAIQLTFENQNIPHFTVSEMAR